MINGITRRTLFLRLASFAALCGLTGVPVPARAVPPRIAAWGHTLPGGAAVRVVGQRCLAAGAAEEDPLVLAAALDAATRRPAGGRPSREALAQVRRREFAAGDVVRVDGWVLSRSEARSYALAALLQGSAIS